MHIRQTLSVVLAVVLLVTAVAPARAEAIEPLTIIAIAGVAVAVVILVAYLVVANVHESRQPGALLRDDLPQQGDEAAVVVAFSRQSSAESP